MRVEYVCGKKWVYLAVRHSDMITTIMYGFMDQFTTFNKSPVFCILLKVVVHKFEYIYTH